MKRALGLALAAVMVMPLATHAIDVSPRIEWRSGGIDLVADDFQLRVTGREEADPPTPAVLQEALTAPDEVLAEGRTYVDHADLGVYWYEHGAQRLNFNLDLDEDEWWIDSIWADDGHGPDSGWIYFRDLERRTRTPLGASLEGDLRLKSDGADRGEYRRQGAAEIWFDGLRLTAFEPGTRPAPLIDCAPVDSPMIEVEPRSGGWDTTFHDGILEGPGEPLDGLEDMTLAAVESALQEAGLCYRFDYVWRRTPRFEDSRLDEKGATVSDLRCSAPEAGEIVDLSFGPDDPSGKPDPIVYVVVNDTEPHDWPDPPPYGTDCPSQ